MFSSLPLFKKKTKCKSFSLSDFTLRCCPIIFFFGQPLTAASHTGHTVTNYSAPRRVVCPAINVQQGFKHGGCCECNLAFSLALESNFQTVLEKTLESPLDCKEIQPVHPKGNQSWIFIGRTDAEADAPILWPPDAKNWFIGKDPAAGKD